MLDIDIPQEIDRLVGGHSNDFPFPFDDGDSFTPSDSEIFTGGPKYMPPMDYLADLGACVNPNSVMPLMNTSALLLNSPKIDLNTINFAAHSPPLSPKVEKIRTNLNFNNITNVPSNQQQHRRTSSPVVITPTIPKIKSVKSSDGGMIKVPGSIATADKRISQQISTTVIKPDPDHCDQQTKGVLHSIAPGIGGLTFANTIDYNKMKQTSNQKTSSMVLNGNVVVKKERDSSPLHNMTTLHSGNYTNQHKLLSRAQNKVSTPTSSPSSHHNHHISSNQSSKKSSKQQSPAEPEYPKPAYSYSCLIAMSLKNSRSGSLPVSEIYSFMCEHFPYFKTAPNGWKNSVRHNLSLNKCFEKIEKPPTNGGQRKGCLWAMNPAKIAKMDDEVLKWSKKDPMAIKIAMVYPEHLEALERGEMKHGSTGEEDDLEGEIISEEEENSDLDQEIDENLLQTPESFIDDDVDLEAAVHNIAGVLKRERDFDDEVGFLLLL